MILQDSVTAAENVRPGGAAAASDRREIDLSLRQLVFISLARCRRRGSAPVAVAFACLSLGLLTSGCASRSLIPEAQAVAIKQRERALASHAAAIQGAIK